MNKKRKIENKKIEILIAEDSPTQALRLKNLLETHGYKTVVARNGKEALTQLKKHKPTLIISDVVMPVMDGYTLCSKIKSDEKLADIPVILLTGLSDPDDVIKGLKCGADNFVTKPYSEKYLLSRIQYTVLNKELRKTQITEIGVEVFFGGQKHLITSNRLQIVDLLLSTFENAVQKSKELDQANKELRSTQHELKALNEKLEDKVKERTQRVRHLNNMLRAIRNINKIIITEKDRNRLIRDACRNFVETRGFQSAWITLLDESRKLMTSARAGIGNTFSALVKQLKRGEFTECIKRALAKPGIVAIKDPASTCGDCPLANIKEECGALSSRLENNGKIYGVLTVSLPNDYFSGKEERSLFEEVVGDISYALHHIEGEEKREQAEKQIKASLREKEVLLQEIHHRVKNNMQIISSLIKLQSRHIKDEQALEKFMSTQNRVQSMAIIHDRLYRSKDFARVDFAEYALSLANHLFSMYGIDQSTTKLKTDIKDIFLNINTAIPCGLIINELVSNSLKHAFPDSKKGEIKITMHALNKKEIELTVTDNGIGLPKDIDIRKTESLGLHLVTILAEDQLHGKIKLDRTKGTSFQIKLRVKQ
jgi:two-component sensor histidine kinase/CheY-like chemotaxis protein